MAHWNEITEKDVQQVMPFLLAMGCQPSDNITLAKIDGVLHIRDYLGVMWMPVTGLTQLELFNEQQLAYHRTDS